MHAVARLNPIFCLILCALSVSCCFALDEGILTPTAGASVSQEEQEFQDAMAVWYKHDYPDGPGSRP